MLLCTDCSSLALEIGVDVNAITMSWPILTQDDLTTDNRDMAVGDITFTDILIEEKFHVSDEYLPKGRHFFEGWQT